MRVFLSKIFSFLKAGRGRSLVFVLPLFLLVAVFVLFPHPANASVLDTFDPSNWMKWIGERMAEFFYALGYDMISLGYHLVVAAADASVKLVDNPNITLQWQGTKKVTLGLFGAAVLAIAFMNMMKIKIDEWGFQRLIPKLFLVAFFVYFSKFICDSVINFSHALTFSLAHENLEKFDTFMKAIGEDMRTGNIPSLPMALGIFLIAFLTMLMLILLAAILFVRGFMLGLLVVISPLAFAVLAVPVTQQFFKKFWDMFVKWAFFLPICFFILAIGLGFTSASMSDSGKGLKPFSDAIQKSGDNDDGGMKVLADFDAFLLGAIAIPMAVFLPLGFLGAFGKFMQGAMKKGGKAGVNALPAPINPNAWKNWAKSRGEKSAAIKQAKVGGYMRKPFMTQSGEMGRIGRFINKDTEESIALERSKAAKEAASIGLNDKKFANAALMHKLNPGDSAAKAEYEAQRKANPRLAKRYDSFTAKHGAAATGALFEATRDAGWIGGKTIDNANFDKAFGKELIGGKMAEKRLDIIKPNIHDLDVEALGKLNDDAFDPAHSKFDGTSFHGTEFSGLVNDVVNAPRDKVSAKRKGQLADMADHHGNAAEAARIRASI